MNVAVQDLHVVIEAAKKLGGKVVLGGHSLGGSVVTAYATWDFNGRAGADDLAGLVYIDGGSTATPVSAQAATQELQALDAPSATPLAGLRRDRGALRRNLRRHRISVRALGPERAFAGSDLGTPAV